MRNGESLNTRAFDRSTGHGDGLGDSAPHRVLLASVARGKQVLQMVSTQNSHLSASCRDALLGDELLQDDQGDTDTNSEMAANKDVSIFCVDAEAGNDVDEPATVGIMMIGTRVERTLPCGPAYECLLHNGDILLEVQHTRRIRLCTHEHTHC